MCGIIGYIGFRKASEILSDGLLALEYRGYDSVGISTYDKQKNKIEIRKDAGRIKDVSKRLEFEQLTGNIGIGHTRWATHGIPCMDNSHPHTDCTGNVVIVHNGVLENYNTLKHELKGTHTFKSNTDSEVIAHLIEDELKTKKPYEAFKSAISKLKGSFAILAIIKGDDKIFFVKNKTPLVFGLGENENFAASDMTPLIKYTNKMIPLEDGEFGYLNQFEIHVENKNGPINVISRMESIDWTPQMASKGGYPHYMLKEIYEQKDVINQILASNTQNGRDLIDNHDKIHIVACGTSYHAGLILKYLLNKKLNKSADAFIASEYPYISNPDKNTLIIAITQSGETADTLEAIKYAKKNGSKLLTLTNVVGSSITRYADQIIYLNAGPEVGVAATKTFTSQLAIIYKLIFGNTISDKIKNLLINGYSTFDTIDLIAERIYKKSNVFFLGRGLSYPIAMEGALKLKEISYIHAEAYPGGELKHGPLSLIEEGVPVFVLAPHDNTTRKIHGNLKEVKSRGGIVISLTDVDYISNDSDHVIKIASDKSNPELSIFSMLLPLQYLAYKVSVLKGYDPDKPRNLAKSVTVE